MNVRPVVAALIALLPLNAPAMAEDYPTRPAP